MGQEGKCSFMFQGLLLKSESADLGWMSVPVCSATKTCPTLCNPVVAPQAPLSMGFPRQEYGSSFPLPPPGDLPNPGVEPVSPSLAGGLFTTESAGKPTWVEQCPVKVHVHPEPETVTLLENRVFRCNQVKLRSHWVQ